LKDSVQLDKISVPWGTSVSEGTTESVRAVSRDTAQDMGICADIGSIRREGRFSRIERERYVLKQVGCQPKGSKALHQR
jgi:hypothetical protein